MNIADPEIGLCSGRSRSSARCSSPSCFRLCTTSIVREAIRFQGREAEWHEVVRECDKFDAEITHEIRTEKFTHAELDEEEQNLERLRRWHRELVSRDVIGAPSAPEAELRLKASSELLEGFAQQVFDHEGGV